MKYLLDGQNINIIINYKRIKNLYFRVDENNNLVVSAPLKTSEKEIIKILEENKIPIIKMLNKNKEKTKDNDKFLYLGKKYDIKYISSLNKVGFKDNCIYAKDEKELEKFWLKECFHVFESEIEICKKCFNNLPEFKLKVRKMKTRWGVCNTKDKIITLNSELLKKKVDLIDYVIIHEMCHFYEGNHSKDFWNLVGKAYPRYKEARKELRG